MSTAMELREAREVKKCSKCGEAKALSDFHVRRGGTLYSECKKCLNFRTSSKNRNRREYRLSPRGVAQDLIVHAQRRAEKKNLPIDIDIAWISEKIAAGYCEKTKIPFALVDGRSPFGPSLDQIIPGNGYTRDNTQVVCWIYNAAKGAGTHDDVMRLVEALNVK